MQRFSFSLFALIVCTALTLGCSRGPKVSTPEEAAASMDSSMSYDTMEAAPTPDSAMGGADASAGGANP